jgi:hypothetical protein
MRCCIQAGIRAYDIAPGAIEPDTLGCDALQEMLEAADALNSQLPTPALEELVARGYEVRSLPKIISYHGVYLV